MSRSRCRSLCGAAALVLLALVTTVPVGAQDQPPHPFAPTWANLAGARVFKEKGCGQCHAIRGVGPTVGPELARIEKNTFVDLGAAMSNHLRGVNIPRPTLTADEVTALIAFVFTVQYYDVPGDPEVGQRLFRDKACIRCHAVGGTGGRVGPNLDFLGRADSPVLIAAALWNHGPEMRETLRAEGIPRPTFAPKELGHLIAYIQSAAEVEAGTPRQVVPGTPERGARLFQEKRCVICHSVGGTGGSVGPELGRALHVSVTDFAARMWNHGSEMATKMKELGIQVPRVSGQEMADLVAFLYASHYFDEPGDARRGEQLVRDKNCVPCHPVRERDGAIAAPLATYEAFRSVPGLVASLWNHPRYLEAQRQEVSWPVLTGRELSDMAAYLSIVAAPPASTPEARQD